MKIEIILRVLVLTVLIFAFASCEKDEISFNKAENYLDVDITKPFCEYNDAEQNIYFDARDRFGKYVSLQDGHYVLADNCDAEFLNLSIAVFNHFKMLLEQTNEDLISLNVWENGKGKLQVVLGNQEFFPTVKTRAIEQGGITMVEVDWYGYNIYLSNRALHDIALGASIATVILAACPEAVGTKIAAVLTGLCAIAAQELEYRYPDGIILRVANIPGTGCIPFDLEGQ